MKLTEQEFLSNFYEDNSSYDYFYIFRQYTTSVWSLMSKIYKNYPLDSKPYRIFRDYLEEYWLKPKYPTEYVLCYKRKSPYPNYNDITFSEHVGFLDDTYRKMMEEAPNDVYKLQYKPRWKVEWNPEYLHFVVGALLYTADDKVIVLHRRYGQFKDKLTTIMGHCAYTEETVPCAFTVFCKPLHSLTIQDIGSLLMCDMKRELREEVGVESVNINPSQCFYRTPNHMEIDKLSYYHAGFLFSHATTDIKSTDIVSQEPNKNTVVVYDKDKLATITKENTDGWLYEVLAHSGAISLNKHSIDVDMFKPK